MYNHSNFSKLPLLVFKCTWILEAYWDYLKASIKLCAEPLYTCIRCCLFTASWTSLLIIKAVIISFAASIPEPVTSLRGCVVEPFDLKVWTSSPFFLLLTDTNWSYLRFWQKWKIKGEFHIWSAMTHFKNIMKIYQFMYFLNYDWSTFTIVSMIITEKRAELTSGTTVIVSSLGRGFSIRTTSIHCLIAEISWRSPIKVTTLKVGSCTEEHKSKFSGKF